MSRQQGSDEPRRNEHAGEPAVRKQRALRNLDEGVLIRGSRQRFVIRCQICGGLKTIEQRMIGGERRMFGVLDLKT